MPLRSASLTGDPVLEECLSGRHRMLVGEEGLSVMRMQSGLLALGRSVGPRGADGIFAQDTGDAVVAYKTAKGLFPNDPVVGPGTTKALDDDLFIDPPELDPTFGEFSPAVVEHRLEQFVARELVTMRQAPFDSWRRMLGTFALNALNSGELLGIVAGSRAIDLRDRYLVVADAMQEGGLSAEVFFDDAIILGEALARTVTFFVGGQLRAFVVVRDDVIRGRAVIKRNSNHTVAPAPLQGVVVHELTHARNLTNIQALLATPDSDLTAFADPAVAADRTAATGQSTAHVLRSYVSEIMARHVHWVVLQEQAGTPGGIAVRGLTTDELAAAALLYYQELRNVFDSNGYAAALDPQGAAVRFRQLQLWLDLCAAQSFSDIADDDQQSTLVFQGAALFCADQISNPTLDIAHQKDGLFPLLQDFH